MSRASRVTLVCAGLLAGAIVGAAAPHDVTITMRQQAFEPATLRVAAGTRITWTNADDMPHSVTAADSRFDSGPIPPGKSFQWTAQGSGEIAYRCIFHPSMTATVTVTAPTDAVAK